MEEGDCANLLAFRLSAYCTGTETAHKLETHCPEVGREFQLFFPFSSSGSLYCVFYPTD